MIKNSTAISRISSTASLQLSKDCHSQKKNTFLLTIFLHKRNFMSALTICTFIMTRTFFAVYVRPPFLRKNLRDGKKLGRLSSRCGDKFRYRRKKAN